MPQELKTHTQSLVGWVRAAFKKRSQQVLLSRPPTISPMWSGATGVVLDRITPACLQPGELTANPERQGSPRQPHPTRPHPDCGSPILSHRLSRLGQPGHLPPGLRVHVHRVWDRFPRPTHPSAAGSVCPGESSFQGYRLLLTLARMSKGREGAGGGEREK